MNAIQGGLPPKQAPIPISNTDMAFFFLSCFKYHVTYISIHMLYCIASLWKRELR